jgi:Rrf2 family iron-sulfur cluster assembly transcriptional regulator
MRLTTRGRYAVTAMLDLAVSGEDGPVTAADISRRQDISLLYLEQLFARLRHHRLVRSVRGPGGGYCLTKSPHEISVSDIIRAVDEPTDATQCKGKLNCRAGKRCMTHDLWADLNMEINRYLASVSLARLAANQRQRSASVQPLKVALRTQRPATRAATRHRAVLEDGGTRVAETAMENEASPSLAIGSDKSVTI